MQQVISSSKRNFLKGRIRGVHPIRPPWSIREQDFISSCNRCGDCIAQCPVNIIQAGDGGFPVMNFTTAGCDFCGRCAESCKTGALDQQQPEAFRLPARINDQCFSERGILCRSCGEVCENQAITFRLAIGGVTHVELNTELCNGCGECVSICPAYAINFEHRD